jgi:hypothetical protein
MAFHSCLVLQVVVSGGDLTRKLWLQGALVFATLSKLANTHGYDSNDCLQSGGQPRHTPEPPALSSFSARAQHFSMLDETRPRTVGFAAPQV